MMTNSIFNFKDAGRQCDHVDHNDFFKSPSLDSSTVVTSWHIKLKMLFTFAYS